MSDVLATLFDDFDRGRISRRRLLQALGVAVAMRPAMALAQGQCGDRGRAGQPGCETVLAPPPFEPTGWKTVLLDYFTVQVGDYEKEAAYYEALMGWKIRSNDGKQAVLDIGDWGGLVIRGGYQPPAPPPPAPAAAGGDAAAGRGAAAGNAGAGGGNAGAGGGRGGQGGGRGTPRMAQFDSFCLGIDPWNAKTVEAELKKRGLNPVADNRAGGFESFHIKDPNGWALQISNGNRRNRRQGPANGKVSAPPPFDPTGWKSVWLDHISFEVTDYKKGAAFYNALLGWELGQDEGSQNTCKIGDVGGIIIRRGGGGNRGGAADPNAPPRAGVGHIAFGITPWDPDAVKAELDKRGLSARVDTGGSGNTMDDLRKANYQSFHTTTPNGFDLQISDRTTAKR